VVEQLAVNTIPHAIIYSMKDKRSYADRREYLIIAVAKRRKDLKVMAFNYKGGRCSMCGYDKRVDALEFHHLYNKEFGLSKSGITRSWERAKDELDKCIIVCSNCHKEVHAYKTQPQMETFE
jgi:5-methylcytosine-specific restriction endonuclease McrA